MDTLPDIFPSEDGALIALHEATAGGVALGSRLLVPPGFAGVVVKDGKPLDALPSGDHLLEPALLPGLTQKVKPRFGGGVPIFGRHQIFVGHQV